MFLDHDELPPLIYLAGPISKGNIVANVAQADDAMLALMEAGFAVVNPMLTCWAGAGRVLTERPMTYAKPLASAHGGFAYLRHEDWLRNCFPVVARCDAVLRLPGESDGADAEVAFAKSKRIPTFTDLAELVRTLKG